MHALRAWQEQNLIAFIADGSILPRRSGIDDRPLRSGAVPFKSPQSLRVHVELPHAGTVAGMGIRPGVTLLVGGGFHVNQRCSAPCRMVSTTTVPTTDAIW